MALDPHRHARLAAGAAPGARDARPAGRGPRAAHELRDRRHQDQRRPDPGPRAGARPAARACSPRRSTPRCCAARSTSPCIPRRICRRVLPDGIAHRRLSAARGPARRADLGARRRRSPGCRTGGTLGTASLRRQAQVKRLRPDLDVGLLRGNVETRLGKAERGEIDATLLAYAGLKRLGPRASRDRAAGDRRIPAGRRAGRDRRSPRAPRRWRRADGAGADPRRGDGRGARLRARVPRGARRLLQDADRRPCAARGRTRCGFAARSIAPTAPRRSRSSARARPRMRRRSATQAGRELLARLPWACWRTAAPRVH